MKLPFRITLFIVIVDLLLPRCANPGRPSGGPTDTVPPVLLSSEPAIGTRNFKGQTITLELSEYINADKLQQQLIITPRTDITYKSIVKRDKLLIKLSQALADTTTYNFNFASGITDITEKNPASNLSIAFSTGPTIDSMSISGKVQHLLTQEPAKEHLVGLYRLTDTLDYFKEKPLYFTTSTDSGTFQMSYIKKGVYKLVSFEDLNANQILDPQEEAHAFLKGPVLLDSTIQIQKPLRSILQNIKPIEIISVRPTGPYIEAKANKQISSYHLEPSNLYHQITGENLEIIRIYKPQNLNYGDSITLQIMVQDSLGNTASDTSKTAYLSSNRKLKPLTAKNQSDNIIWSDTLKFSTTFNKPIISHSIPFALLQIDSTKKIEIPVYVTWNTSQTIATFRAPIQPDTILAQLAKLLPPDSIKIDTTETFQLRPIEPTSLIKEIPLQLLIPPAAMISVENDTTSLLRWAVKSKPQKKGGTLLITLNTEIESFEFQLLQNDKPVYRIYNQRQIELSKVPPGTYNIRILIDSNQDGSWDFGNLLLDQEPEEVYLYPEELSLRENWVNEFTITF